MLVLDQIAAAGDTGHTMKTSALVIASDLNANPLPVEIIGGADGKAAMDALHRRISERAYELFKSGGSTLGQDLNNWLRAETEILNRIPEVRKSGPWLIVNLYLPYAPAEAFKLLVSEDRALVTIEFPVIAELQDGIKKTLTSYYLAEWRAKVDPATASAYLKSGTLTVEVKMAPLIIISPEKKNW